MSTVNEPPHRLSPGRKPDEEEHMKRIGFLAFVILATVLVTLAFTAAVSPGAAAPVLVLAAAPATPAAAAMPEPHPHIQAAIKAMKAAKDELYAGEHDFHGHRAKSIAHLDEAINEAEYCEKEP